MAVFPDGSHDPRIRLNLDGFDHGPKSRRALRYFKYRITNAVAIANADLIIRKSIDGEVFSELAVGKIVAAQKALPVMVRVHLVDEYGAVPPS